MVRAGSARSIEAGTVHATPSFGGRHPRARKGGTGRPRNERWRNRWQGEGRQERPEGVPAKRRNRDDMPRNPKSSRYSQEAPPPEEEGVPRGKSPDSGRVKADTCCSRQTKRRGDPRRASESPWGRRGPRRTRRTQAGGCDPPRGQEEKPGPRYRGATEEGQTPRTRAIPEAAPVIQGKRGGRF